MKTYFEQILGRIFSRGAPVEYAGGINFAAPLAATRNDAANTIDVTIDGGGGPSLSDATPAAVAWGSGSPGSSEEASRADHAHPLPAIDPGAVLANMSDTPMQPAATGPYNLLFVDPNANNFRLYVTPRGYGTVTALADAANVNVDIALTEDGSYDFFVLVRLKLVGGTRRTIAARICGNRASDTLSIEGSQVDVAFGGVTTGITLTLSATGGDLRCNVKNETGAVANGHVHVGWAIEDMIEDP